ncbi:MAG: helix-turn-helix transcriptional regulator [Cytophagales bacterium]|jgi:predicted RNase H-like HicB family nuclease|nr:helix-turn-helix transcriptional regulator [Cytophagales bacterium]MCA6387546.1 helix-turn-helix transcriptional regulator [Cytophagales bacterium]MCA6391937.1 helix-turn-helix transcriptional regulator [Cytophagales bacterium]MCA6396362.1 helix-turn-helix transcriptional regulator [Cytophagales bacterium]MCA6399880.1 helix-turn-helix transcriptional regulator [Cytophagales bacterium]
MVKVSIKKKVVAKVEKTKTGFSAFAIDYPVFTTGKTISELTKNLAEALNLYFEDDGYRVEEKNIDLEIDLQQFFQFYRVINAKFLADRIGMNPTLLSQYVQGRKKPSLLQTEKILNGIREVGRELSELSFAP